MYNTTNNSNESDHTKRLMQGLKCADILALKQNRSLLASFLQEKLSENNSGKLNQLIDNLQPFGSQEAGLYGSHHERLTTLRKEMIKNNLHGYFLSTNDEYLSEYTPLYSKRLFYLTGFSGSMGFCIILQNKAAIFVDGRYTTQAKKQTDSSLYEILPLTLNSMANFIIEHFKGTLEEKTIGFNSKIFSFSMIKNLSELLEAQKNNPSDSSAPKIELIHVQKSLIDSIWESQPAKPVSPIYMYDVKYAGEDITQKVNKVTNYLQHNKLDALIVTALDSIAWLLNIRGHDVECSPFTLASLVVYSNSKIQLFINLDSLTLEVKTTLAKHNVECLELNELHKTLTNMQGLHIGVSQESSFYYYAMLESNSVLKLLESDYISDLKVQKNPVEGQNTELAHIIDGAALTKLICWLYKKASSGSLCELSISQKLDQIKAVLPTYRGNSFSSIVAVGPNAAFPHYHSSEATNLYLEQGGTLLIDSGAQYLEGTTDVTRTLSFDSTSVDFKRHYTLVLKGLIALSSLKFPEGTPCHNLDAIARQYLWREQEDYAHGTGHGVGHYLSVHEGPIKFNQACSYPVKSNMVFSIEPGYYLVGSYGIRIENLVITQQCLGGSGFLEFKTLTMAPIDLSCVDLALLSQQEKDWLNTYHEDVCQKLTSRLDREEAELLRSLTKPV